jgi:hypothetical protein
VKKGQHRRSTGDLALNFFGNGSAKRLNTPPQDLCHAGVCGGERGEAGRAEFYLTAGKIYAAKNKLHAVWALSARVNSQPCLCAGLQGQLYEEHGNIHSRCDSFGDLIADKKAQSYEKVRLAFIHIQVDTWVYITVRHLGYDTVFITTFGGFLYYGPAIRMGPINQDLRHLTGI